MIPSRLIDAATPLAREERIDLTATNGARRINDALNVLIGDAGRWRERDALDETFPAARAPTRVRRCLALGGHAPHGRTQPQGRSHRPRHGRGDELALAITTLRSSMHFRTATAAGHVSPPSSWRRSRASNASRGGGRRSLNCRKRGAPTSRRSRPSMPVISRH